MWTYEMQGGLIGGCVQVTWLGNYVESEVLAVVVMKSSVFWDVMPCSHWKSPSVSEKHVASIVRVKEEAKQ
jgi:hypothetical protein